MYQKYLESKKQQEEEKKKKIRKKKKRRKEKEKNPREIMTNYKNRTGNLLSRVAGQLLYHDVFSTYMRHFIQDDPHPLKDVIQDIMTLQVHCQRGAP
jgi:hypothetical protein